MAKFVRTFEAAEILETTTASIMVIAHQHKNKHGEYPVWYSSNGKRGASKSYVDIEYLLCLIDKEKYYYKIATDKLYWYLTDTVGLKQEQIAIRMAKLSPIYTTPMTWRSFMTQGLFQPPSMKLSFRETRLSEFVRIGMELVDEFVRIGKQLIEENEMK